MSIPQNELEQISNELSTRVLDVGKNKKKKTRVFLNAENKDWYNDFKTRMRVKINPKPLLAWDLTFVGMMQHPEKAGKLINEFEEIIYEENS